MDMQRLKKYIEVVIKRGVNLKAGQALFIDADVEAYSIVHETIVKAHEEGAGEIGVYWRDKKLEYFNMMAGKSVFKFDKTEEIKYREYAEKQAALLRIESPDFDVFQNVPEELLQKKVLHERVLRQKYTKSCGVIPNCVICAPNMSWSKRVYPDLGGDEALGRLWETVFTAMRLNEEEPVESWDRFVGNLKIRRTLFEEKAYKEFWYSGIGTDLKISPISNAKWYGGCSEILGTDEFYIPNLPTEELFTVPDKYSANGTLSSTRPLTFEGKVIENFRFVFQNGKIVEFSAEIGEEILKRILETDEGACYLGEMAFVDSDSPIARMNTIFYNTLYDENASCHMALGFGLEDANKSDAERERRGINSSALHVDFMIGSEDMSIKGMQNDGTWDDIFINGKWAGIFAV